MPAAEDPPSGRPPGEWVPPVAEAPLCAVCGQRGCSPVCGLRAYPSPAGLAMFTVYRGAADLPTPYGVREWSISGAGPVPGRVWPAATLEQARALIPASASFRIPPAPEDDPCVLETWV